MSATRTLITETELNHSTIHGITTGKITAQIDWKYSGYGNRCSWIDSKVLNAAVRAAVE